MTAAPCNNLVTYLYRGGPWCRIPVQHGCGSLEFIARGAVPPTLFRLMSFAGRYFVRRADEQLFEVDRNIAFLEIAGLRSVLWLTTGVLKGNRSDPGTQCGFLFADRPLGGCNSLTRGLVAPSRPEPISFRARDCDRESKDFFNDSCTFRPRAPTAGATLVFFSPSALYPNRTVA